MSGGACPVCDAPPGRWIGHEVRGVYDGVLYWSCTNCGHAWSHWAGVHDFRHKKAEEHIARFHRGIADVDTDKL